MRIKRYLELQPTWPATGQHILAHFDESSVHVYQAYKPSIALYAVQNQRFAKDFSFNRMSWIKPNFLWMMYRSGWAQKADQERILAVELPRDFFDDLLRSSVPSAHDSPRYRSREAWQAAVQGSDVRRQWDPDHDPSGRPLERRALQLGLRGDTLKRFATNEVVSITDITDFVADQRRNLDDLASLVVPHERVYIPDSLTADVVGIDLPG